MNQSFVCIAGAQRCGTTYLYSVLDEHPEIYMAKPIRPEPKFFLSEENFQKGKTGYLQQYFSGIDNTCRVIGEKGTSYIEFAEVPARIAAFFPDAKVILMLRNPVQRALSNYYFSFQNGLETRKLDEVFSGKIPAPELKHSVSVSPFNYLGRGEYHRYLAPYIHTFKHNLRICIFEETVATKESIQSIYRWLGVDDQFVPSTLNSTVNAGPDHYPEQVDPSITGFLKGYYKPHNQLLEQLLNRSIPAWHD